MTEREVIKYFKDANRTNNIVCVLPKSDIGKCVINALEKQIPKKPMNNKHTVSISNTAVKFVDWWKCGKCNGDLKRQFVCCPYCQTVIDWSDEE